MNGRGACGGVRLRLRLAGGVAALMVTVASGAPAAPAMPSGTERTDTGARPYRVIDDAGSTLALAHAAQRIVSLSPGITELLFGLGAGAQLVAVSEFSDTPDAARRLPRVARAQGIDLERIAALHPDLIVAWGSGYSPALLEALQRLGVPVYVHEPRSLEGIASAIERLGVLSGAPAAAAQAAQLRERAQALRARYGGRRVVPAFYQVWREPLMTLTGRHLTSELMELCGARNIFASLAPLVATVDIESVIAARPELIFTAESGGTDRGALDFWRAYPQVPAVAHARLATLDADALDRATLRVLDATQALCEQVDAARRP